MKLLIGILVFHGVIHLLGFTKAFGLAPLSRLKEEITKINGVLWLGTSACYLTGSLLLLFGNDAWTLASFIALPISQYLILVSWNDAKWGSPINAIILAAAVIGYGSSKFYNSYRNEVKIELAGSPSGPGSILTENDIKNLPKPVQKYIRYSGALGQPKVNNFKVELAGQIRKDEKSAWMPFISEQYNFLTPATRLFFMKAVMRDLPVSGFHSFRGGQASMDIRLLSLFNVQYQSGKEMSIAETVTFFNDMCCMAPAALIDKRIKWLDIDDLKVMARFTNNNVSITAWLYFDDKGELVNFSSDDRYAVQENGTMKQLPWSTPLKDYRIFENRKLPGYAMLSTSMTAAIWSTEISKLWASSTIAKTSEIDPAGMGGPLDSLKAELKMHYSALIHCRG
jgi:hypothetical protein